MASSAGTGELRAGWGAGRAVLRGDRQAARRPLDRLADRHRGLRAHGPHALAHPRGDRRAPPAQGALRLAAVRFQRPVALRARPHRPLLLVLLHRALALRRRARGLCDHRQLYCRRVRDGTATSAVRLRAVRH
eukprot:2269256-Rhodomonas_salina.2